jgi:hypothetical protein
MSKCWRRGERKKIVEHRNLLSYQAYYHDHSLASRGGWRLQVEEHYAMIVESNRVSSHFELPTPNEIKRPSNSMNIGRCQNLK